MTDRQLEAWWQVIRGARWFGGKGLEASLSSVQPLGWLTHEGTLPAVRPEIATIDYADGRREHYQLLVGYTLSPTAPVVGTVTDPEHGDLQIVEAPADAACMAALLTALADPDHPAMEWITAEAVNPAAPTRVWAGEQSNTTITLGSDRMLKVFRKLEGGRNLDVEVLAALNSSGITPELYGTLVGELPGADGGPADLAMFVERVQGVTDGWEWACARCVEGAPITREASWLGSALREVHRRLAETFGTSTTSGAAVTETMAARLDAAAVQVSELAGVRSSVELALRALAGSDLITQRVHGDFHLGQVLHSAGGWTIIDFEGEPLKSLAERRAPDSVWRDVAGMLRSFDYVRSAHPEPGSDAARSWCAAARAAFLDGYCDGIEPDHAVLDAYELDKAIYEVVYESRNRPDWVHIPLGAVHDVAQRTALSPMHNPKEN